MSKRKIALENRKCLRLHSQHSLTLKLTWHGLHAVEKCVEREIIKRDGILTNGKILFL